MTELHCTTCDAIVAAGSRSCPGCGLQITTQAAPAVYVERARFPLWPVILGGLFLFFLIAHEADRHGTAKAADAQAAFVADLQSGQINSAAAFEVRCGQARWTKPARDGVELHYVANGDYFVTFTNAGPHLELEHLDLSSGKPLTYRTNISASQLYAVLGCK